MRVGSGREVCCRKEERRGRLAGAREEDRERKKMEEEGNGDGDGDG
jgi:hypothetical protein